MFFPPNLYDLISKITNCFDRSICLTREKTKKKILMHVIDEVLILISLTMLVLRIRMKLLRKLFEYVDFIII